MKKEKLIIIGAGLCGLQTAFLLQDYYDITILEARDRMGGRVLGAGEHDMGPSWVWGHHQNILSLIDERKLELFTQHTQGLALYDTPDGVQKFTPQPQAPSARIVGGISALIEAVYKTLISPKLHINEVVTGINNRPDGLEVITKSGIFQADKVISTLPPRVAIETLQYEPDLPPQSKQNMLNTPTWMGHSAKCVIEFKRAFWKESGLSGFAFSPLGPLSEIHDASTQNHPALFGFVHSRAEHDNIKEAIIEQLVRLFGIEAKNYTNFFLVDWKKEPFTATDEDAKGLSTHPEYGLDEKHFEGKLIFSGTETAFSEGGYLEGALISAMRTAEYLKSL